jgi:hypothetical protein
MYASLFETSGALHLDVFEQPCQKLFFVNLLESQEIDLLAAERLPRVKA